MKTAAKLLLTVMCLLLTVSAFFSCDDVYEKEIFTLDTIVVEKGYERFADLSHRWDSTARKRVIDKMTSNMKVWRLAGTERTIMYDDTFYPQLTAESVLLWEKDTVSAELLSAPVINSYLHRTTSTDDSELDTVYVALKDGQKIWYPIKITNKKVKVGNTEYGFGSLALIQAVYEGTTHQLISSTETATVYNTVYKTTLELQEKYVDHPQIFKVPVYAYATRTVLKEQKPDEQNVVVTCKGRNRTPIDSLTEKIRFTEVFTYPATGRSNEVEVSIILNHRFRGKNFSQPTYDLDYKRAGTNGIREGTESFVRTEGNWTVYERTDNYGAPFSNGLDMDTFNSSYDLMHQRAVYKDEYIEVKFGYEGIRIVEVETKVNKQTTTSATLYNRVNAIYLGFGQDLENHVSLYIR